MTRAAVAVAGGGPAGAALACLAARSGRDTVVIERETGPRDKVCGDFLSAEAVHYLRALGIAPEASGALPIRRVRLAAGRRVAEARLPFEAWSLRRDVLDELILSRAEAAGARVVRGHRIETLEPERGGAGWTLRLAGADPVTAPVVAIATGKHDLRGWKRGPGRQTDLIGLKWYVRLAPDARLALGDAVELALFGGGYAGLQAVDEDTANLCLVVGRERFACCGHSAERLLEVIGAENDLLAARLAGARFGTAPPRAIASLPYGYVADEPLPPGLVRVGDQAAVIPSLAGDGISLALHGAFRAAGEGGMRPPFANEVRAPVGVATALSLRAVDPRWQSAAVALARHVPSILDVAARLTRLPRRALVG